MALIQEMGHLGTGPPGPSGLHTEAIAGEDTSSLQASLLDFAPQEEKRKWSCLQF